MKIALVTGGSRGIGRAVCIKMAAMGYHVLVNYLANGQAAAETLDRVREAGSTGELLGFDVGNPAQVKQVLGGWMEARPDAYIEVLVNNAGIKDDGLLLWMTDQQWDTVLNASLNGFFYVTRQVLPPMLLKRYGRIVNVVSLSGIKGLPGQANYSAAKGGVIAATKALAQEVGKRGVTVNAVAPGFIRTDMTENIPEADVKAMIPVNRFGTAEEVAHAVGFLASREASYITGDVLSVNGGLYT
jgi:3-oxoacyl-[acyl-carrier protein] reductase